MLLAPEEYEDYVDKSLKFATNRNAEMVQCPKPNCAGASPNPIPTPTLTIFPHEPKSTNFWTLDPRNMLRNMRRSTCMYLLTASP